MSHALQSLISELPEIYQMIFEHPEWNDAASRDCLPRLEVISTVYDTLSNSLGRPLRVLDLGCAQGFYSLSLAKKGASVKGIDFLSQNITLCRALANEHSELDVTFEEGLIETAIDNLVHDQFDIVIGLSVFHHIIHLHGVKQVKKWLSRVLDRVEILLLELALKEEPLYWGPSQPAEPLTLIKDNAFYHQLAEFPTHLSDISRPFYLVSNRRIMIDDFCKPFNRWDNQPYSKSGMAHNSSRRYYFADNYIAKVYNFFNNNDDLSQQINLRNKHELQHEIRFLNNIPHGFTASSLLAYGQNQWQGWCVMERLPGTTLKGKLGQITSAERENILLQLLQQLSILEKAGLYHDDVRIWNILRDDNNQVYLIDYGSISSKQQDCDWPKDLYYSLLITINEILYPEKPRLSEIRSLELSPLNFSMPYSNWIYAFLQKEVSAWSFSLLLDLFQRKESLPSLHESINSVDIWIAETEKWLKQSQLYTNHLHVQNKISLEHLASSVESLAMSLRQEDHEYVDKLRQENREYIDNLRQEHHESIGQLQREFSEKFIQPLERLVLQQENHAIPNENDIHGKVPVSSTEELLNSDGFPAEDKSLKEILNYYESMGRKNAQLQSENQQLQSENQQLRQYVEALTQSRSWRMTALYRYIGIQVYLLRKYGLLQRFKHLLRLCITGIFDFLNRHPGMKVRAVQLLHKAGMFEPVKAIYRRVYPRLNENVIECPDQSAWVLLDPEHRLPPEVNSFFEKLQGQ